MSFFSQPFHTNQRESSDLSFTPLFRLLSDWDDFGHQIAPIDSRHTGHHHARHVVRTFVPRFDFRETEASFELQGELPGINKQNISIDFTDNQTLVIKGKSERSYESGTPPAGWVTGSTASGAITEGGDNKQQQQHSNGHRASVEDVGEDGEAKTQSTVVATATASAGKKLSTEKESGDRSRYWISERSVGEFSRSFQFSTPVDTEAVAASLNDGILSISVPKAKKPSVRRITVQ